MQLKDRLKGCLICGAIGDAVGGKYEGNEINEDIDFDFDWSISDDTQLTLATCEAIFNTQKVLPEKVAARFLDWYNRRKLTGLGSSTLKALRELQVGGHWALVGRSGEFAAGNGAAMRIAPLAFKKEIDRLTIKDVSNITHKNDEAYTGALGIYYSVLHAINGNWTGEQNLISLILPDLPDTRVKDRLIELNQHSGLSILQIGQKLKATGYVVDSVPISIFAAQKIGQMEFNTIITDLIKIGGDTDTTCSMTGQIIDTLIGTEAIPSDWVSKYQSLQISELVDELAEKWKA
ncbi:ADP-ribosylglycohydrolase family protein [Flammeovirgaceae bacterium SG7u.111]|nr:ADP-ribosylglycohydrolase family protein [Flammeovirgaceae bacterium SG7u.132]WPO34411.1 ADP-ribosylglycohydrolase family protein [Flammeovirgaceae bacterium SG7u.111]